MPRAADTFGAFYKESRGRLLHQVYAYVGNTEVAQRTLADAYVAAAQHWRKVSTLDDPDAWMREHAFSASRRSSNRARRPWFENAMHTDDENRPILVALAGLDPVDRHLLIAYVMDGKSLPAAAREVGLTDSAAQLSLDRSAAALNTEGIDASSKERLGAVLARLRGDLHDEPVDPASRLRREGNRRRRSHMVLAGLTVVALAIGAGALTATQDEETASGQITQGGGATGIEIADPSAPPTESFTVDSLATTDVVSRLAPDELWRVTATSSDFGRSRPIDDCLQVTPSEQRTAHYWVRNFTGGIGGAKTEVVESLQIARSPKAATSAYEMTVMALSTCRGGDVARRLDQFDDLTGAGDAAAMFSYDYSHRSGIQREYIAVANTGLANVVWIVRENGKDPISPRKLARVTAESVDGLCVDAEGGCSEPPVQTTATTPPVPDGRAVGFLTDVDLPLFEGLAAPWVATTPRKTRTNPAATQCDDVDYATAKETRSRSFVIPDARGLPTIFGMSETVAQFRSPVAARKLVNQVERRVSRCEDRDLNITVGAAGEIDDGPVRGQVWQIEQAASENRSLIYRMAIVRVGDAVAQVTFTPSDDYDISREDYIRLAGRAGARLSQLG